jgi:hypothetical protein
MNSASCLTQWISEDPREYWFFMPRKQSPMASVRPRWWIGAPRGSRTGAWIQE